MPSAATGAHRRATLDRAVRRPRSALWRIALWRIAPVAAVVVALAAYLAIRSRSEEHTSELQSQSNLVCRLLLEKKKKTTEITRMIQSTGSRIRRTGTTIWPRAAYCFIDLRRRTMSHKGSQNNRTT